MGSIGVRDGGQGGQLPPQKITKSKSRANVQQKSSEEWEIKKPKSPQFVGQTKAVGQYSLHSRAILAYYKKNWDKLCEFCDKFSDVWKTCLMFRKKSGKFFSAPLIFSFPYAHDG